MGLFPKSLTEYVALAGIPRGPLSKVFLVDTVNGSDSNPGTSFAQPLLTVAAAYALCTANRHDVVLLLGNATADSPTAAITWSKDYTHLVGLTSPLPGMGQRARIVNTAANDLAVLFTLSGAGCIVKNIQFFDGKDKDENASCVVVSGNRNYFENVFVAGMGHATPAARAGSLSLTVSGAENYFLNCTIGLDTIVRAAANAELSLSGSRNTFRDCMFLSYSETSGKFLVKVDNSGGDMRWNLFRGCVFNNYTVNWATGITDAFDMPAAGSTHYIILQDCILVGVGTGWADTVTHIYGAGGAAGAGFGITANPTT